MTEPIKNIIPREVDKNVQPILNSFADMLDEIVNFGSHILQWDSKVEGDEKVGGEENICPIVMLRHFLDLLDSVSILVRHTCGDPSKLLIRSAFETTLSLEYLFEKDTDNRAMAFIVSDILNQIKNIKKFSLTTKEGEELNKTLKSESHHILNDLNKKHDLEKILADKESILKLPQFQKAYKEYLRLKSTGEKNPKWYRFYEGPKNIELLAKHLQQKSSYELLYRKWSGSVHGTDIYLGKLTANNKGFTELVQLRYVKDVQEVVRFSMSLSLMVFKVYTKNRIPEKQQTFIDWYLTIRAKYLSITKNDMIAVI
jgi:hypothetical protein